MVRRESVATVMVLERAQDDGADGGGQAHQQAGDGVGVGGGFETLKQTSTKLRCIGDDREATFT